MTIFLSLCVLGLALILAWGADREWRRGHNLPTALDVAREAAAREANSEIEAIRYRAGELDSVLNAARNAVGLDRDGWRVGE